MTERSARAAADNNVQDVISAIDNYTCGPVRALAQDPPQNSLDARRGGQKVQVVYQVVRRQLDIDNEITILTITDSGTSGLDGPILTAAELADREAAKGQLVIQPGENWAAWEAMRYTKSGEDSLGSRGQGKYAYLYHSLHNPPGASNDLPMHAGRVIILYDTLLSDGEYRLGVRYHNPSSKVIEPPYLGDEARGIITTSYRDEHFTIPLELEPLSKPGTRVIIPYLCQEAVEAIVSGELAHWLQAEWWRPIQKGELEISVTGVDGLTRSIGVPDFWQNQPWDNGDSRLLVKEQIKLPSHSRDDPCLIKRVVLFHDSELNREDFEGPAQFHGVQLLRGGQWIVTLEMGEFSDWIPREHRGGFRGFVEFDRLLERKLRQMENPAHDGYNRRRRLYQEVVREIRELAKQFASQQGWYDSEDTVPDPKFDALVQKFSRLFVAPEPGRLAPADVRWRCSVDAEYPDPGIARANWNDTIRVDATCYRRPSADGEPISFEAELIRPDGSSTSIFDQRRQKMRGRTEDESAAGTNFGRLEILHPGRPGSPFTEPGRYSINVICSSQGKEVATGKCSFHVATDPPQPAVNPVTLQLQALNPEDSSNFIPQGGELRWEATARNRGQSSIGGKLAVVLGEYILLEETADLEPIAIGDQPQTIAFGGSARIQQGLPPDGALPLDWGSSAHVHHQGKASKNQLVLSLPDGRHTVRASLEQEGETLVAARATIWVGTRPEEDDAGDMPFVVNRIDEPLEPRWRLEPPKGRSDDPHTLFWSTANPIYQTVSSLRLSRTESRQPPQEEYLAEIIAEALIDWAARERRQSGDEGPIGLVSARVKSSASDLGNRFEDLLERLESDANDTDPMEYGETQRKMAALMVEVARRARR